ncbi:MAG: glycosyltransferase [Fimbriimonadaceae bacterium]|nr:glycosyltransferase [Fimbriimonadaceae bacterium]
MLSVLIVNWNTRDLLRTCLASVYANPPREPLEVIVVDNASSDGSAEMVRAEFPQVLLVGENSNLGYAKGNNSAFLRAKGDFLLTLNPDTEVLDDALQTAIDLLHQYPGYGCLGAKLIDRDGSTQQSVRGFPTLAGIMGDVTGLARRMPHSRFGSYRLPAFDYESEQDAPQPMGTFLMFRREALQAVGDPKQPFDERFPIFFNEVDLLYRLKEAGFPTLYSPKVRILHLGGASTRQVKKSMIWESHKSLHRYLVKHYRRPWNAVFFPLLALVLYIGALLRAKGYHAGFRP